MIVAVLKAIPEVPLGIFEDKKIANDTLVKRGCNLIVPGKYSREYYGKVYEYEVKEPHYEITKEFSRYMNKRNLSWYSVNGPMEEYTIELKEVRTNIISFGYDDD